jgi:hypothetical protein
MAKKVEIEYSPLDLLYLDPLNPRLGRYLAVAETKQDAILDAMADWTLDELAISFIESGFWPQEALIVVEEVIYGKPALVVLEGNRRLAALKKLQLAINGVAKDRKWRDIAASANALPKDFFERIPYIKVDTRKDVSSFLGFRHVTGIKEWNPAEKAQFITYLIEDEKLSYAEVMRKIGSKTPTVRSHYIAYKLLLQLEDTDGVSVDKIEDKFSVLYLSLRTAGVQEYLDIDIKAEPYIGSSPVPRKKEQQLSNYAKWMFGTTDKPPLFSDSRNIDKFGKLLLSSEAVSYLETTENPNFDLALKKAGGDTEEIISLLSQASDNIELAFGTLHMHKESKDVVTVAKRLAMHVSQFSKIFPAVKTVLEEGLK